MRRSLRNIFFFFSWKLREKDKKKKKNKKNSRTKIFIDTSCPQVVEINSFGGLLFAWFEAYLIERFESVEHSWHWFFVGCYNFFFFSRTLASGPVASPWRYPIIYQFIWLVFIHFCHFDFAWLLTDLLLICYFFFSYALRYCSVMLEFISIVI